MVEETIVVPAAVEELPAVYAAVERFWGALDATLATPPSGSWRNCFTTAVVELATNIIRYAYPADRERGAMQLRLRAHADRVVGRLADRGVPFTGSLAGAAMPPVDPLALPEGGFGFALIRACVDHVAYRRTPRGTNCWRLVKRL